MHLGLGLRVKISEILPTTDCQKMLEPLMITRVKIEKGFSNEKLNPSNKNYPSQKDKPRFNQELTEKNNQK